MSDSTVACNLQNIAVPLKVAARCSASHAFGLLQRHRGMDGLVVTRCTPMQQNQKKLPRKRILQQSESFHLLFQHCPLPIEAIL